MKNTKILLEYIDLERKVKKIESMMERHKKYFALNFKLFLAY